MVCNFKSRSCCGRATGAVTGGGALAALGALFAPDEGLDEATPFVLLSFELQLDKPSADSKVNAATVSTIRAGVQNRFAPDGKVLLDESIEMSLLKFRAASFPDRKSTRLNSSHVS